MKETELRAIVFKESLPVCYEDIEPYLIAELDKLRDDLIALPDRARQDEILALFEKCVNALNDLAENDEIENGIDTEEREGLCNALYKMGDIVGLDAETEYVDSWRDW